MAAKSGIQRALDKFDGSPTKLATAVGNGVKRQHIEHWVKAGRVGAGKCHVVSAATGVSLADLNGSVPWVLIGKPGAPVLTPTAGA